MYIVNVKYCKQPNVQLLGMVASRGAMWGLRVKQLEEMMIWKECRMTLSTGTAAGLNEDMRTEEMSHDENNQDL